MMKRMLLFVGVVLLSAGGVFATIFGTVRGIVHDPQHRPIAGATLKSNRRRPIGRSDADGPGWRIFLWRVPVGDYLVT